MGKPSKLWRSLNLYITHFFTELPKSNNKPISTQISPKPHRPVSTQTITKKSLCNLFNCPAHSKVVFFLPLLPSNMLCTRMARKHSVITRAVWRREELTSCRCRDASPLVLGSKEGDDGEPDIKVDDGFPLFKPHRWSDRSLFGLWDLAWECLGGSASCWGSPELVDERGVAGSEVNRWFSSSMADVFRQPWLEWRRGPCLGLGFVWVCRRGRELDGQHRMEENKSQRSVSFDHGYELTTAVVGVSDD